MTAIEARIWALEEDLVSIHRERMAMRMGKQYELLRRERAKVSPDAKLIVELEQSMKQTERDKRDPAITDRDVIEPLRMRLAEEVAAAGLSTRVQTSAGG